MIDKPPKRKKSRFTISRKASLGYVILLTLLILTSGVSLLSLVRLNMINESIIDQDIPVMNATDRLIDTVLAEENFARRYLILRNTEIRGIFDEKGKEFDGVMDELRSLDEPNNMPFAEIELFHREYRRILGEWLAARDQDLGEPREIETAVKGQQTKLVGLIKEMARRAQVNQQNKAEEIALIGTMAFQVAAVFCSIGLLIALSAAVLITKNISGTIRKLKLAAGRIVQGDFQNIPKITQKDELGAVAVAFIGMAKRLRYLEDLQRKARVQGTVPEAAAPAAGEDVPGEPAMEPVPSSDVRQITGLPAGKAVMEGLRQRIGEGKPFAYCIVRIENVKPYNERYGWGKGDTLIQATAGIVEDAVAEFGGEGDLLGHKWGAQFVILTLPERYEAVTKSIIKEFDEASPFFYDPEDREQGYIVGTTPGGASAMYSLSTVSVAVVTSDSPDARTGDHVQVAAGRLLEWARTQGESVCVVNTAD